jgi:N-acetyl-anhydromuramyl-L-alanine amidase AmpD
MTTYPHATVVLLPDHSAPGTLAQRNLIVLHITAGPTASSAINTFRASKSPHRVSAHFVIDRDGTVYQLLPVEDTAWHASACNSRSVGIEHAAVPGTLPATDEQYAASSKLVTWLCDLLHLPIDRDHVKSHFEASPRDGHTGCCYPTLDPDRVVAMAQTV